MEGSCIEGPNNKTESMFGSLEKKNAGGRPSEDTQRFEEQYMVTYLSICLSVHLSIYLFTSI